MVFHYYEKYMDIVTDYENHPLLHLSLYPDPLSDYFSGSFNSIWALSYDFL